VLSAVQYSFYKGECMAVAAESKQGIQEEMLASSPVTIAQKRADILLGETFVASLAKKDFNGTEVVVDDPDVLDAVLQLREAYAGSQLSMMSRQEIANLDLLISRAYKQ
jgi:hypothetical protein